jgi:hypothetical protein
MKDSRLSRSLILALPLLSIITSFGVVAQQSIRRDRLKQELATSEREIATLEKRYSELVPASGRNAPLQKRHARDHHDGDGD